MNTAGKVAAHKKEHPELYCPKCLWRTGGGLCPRHQTREQLVAKKWNALRPKERLREFRIGNNPFIYSDWENLLDIEKQIVINACRVVGVYGFRGSKEKPGSVCSECGRTVTEAEYTGGESACCRHEVVAEEFYR